MKLFTTFLAFSLLFSVVNPMQANNGKVYVVLFMHNEDTIFEDINDPETEPIFLRNRQKLIEMAQYLKANSVSFAWQSDWKFLEAILAYETPELRSETYDKNLVRWLSEDMRISVNAHSHENYGYNYADVACLIDSFGVSPPNIIGGHIWDPYNKLYANWERFRQPLRGSKYPHYVWNGKVLMGSGTPGHTYDPEPSGIWRPTDKYNYWEDDPDGEILCVGQYTGDIAGVEELVNLYKTDAVPEDSILTCTIHTPQNFNPGFMDDFRQNLVEPLLEMQDKGEIVIVDFVELIEIWRNGFSSATHLYNEPELEIPPQFRVRVPSIAGGIKGLFVQVSLPISARFEYSSCPVAVHVSGGWDGLGVTEKLPRLTNQGFIELDFNFPGSGVFDEQSGGIYDERGGFCIQATADIIKFAMGLETDIFGYRLGEMIGGLKSDSTNTGLIGWSNGGNATITAAGKFGQEVPGLAWILNWESPVGDGMPNVDAGGLNNINPAYNPDTGEFDHNLLAYDGSLETNEGNYGGFYFDINENGALDQEADHLASYHPFMDKSYYSEWIRQAAENINEAFPQHIATLEETEAFWLYRNGEKWINSALEYNPDLMFMVEAGDQDHVQGAPDHPHILVQYNGFLSAGARFVRLNPDRSYIEDITGVEIPEAADNDGFAVFNHQSIRNSLQPRGLPILRYEMSVVAAACELADRTRNNIIDPQIDLSTGVESENLHLDPSMNSFYNYPNPFNESTKIRFKLLKNENIKLEIFNYTGQRLVTISNKKLESGSYSFDWKGEDQYGNPVPPGIYFANITTNSKRYTVRVVLIR